MKKKCKKDIQVSAEILSIRRDVITQTSSEYSAISVTRNTSAVLNHAYNIPKGRITEMA